MEMELNSPPSKCGLYLFNTFLSRELWLEGHERGKSNLSVEKPDKHSAQPVDQG